MKRTSFSRPLFLLVLVPGLAIWLTSSCAKTKKTVSDAVKIDAAKQAFTFGLPLVLMDITRRQQTNTDVATHGEGSPMNQLDNVRRFPTPSDTNVVAPNADTYYCIAWCNFDYGPIYFNMPDPGDRYYVMPFLDAYTNVDTSISSRTKYPHGGRFFIYPDNWTGPWPSDTTMHKIKWTTDFFWLLGRIECDGPQDHDAVVKLQDEMVLMPYFDGKRKGSKEDNVPSGSPNDIVQDSMSIDSFFNYLNDLLVENPPTKADSSVIDFNFWSSLGIGPGKTFSLDSFDQATQESLKAIPNSMYDSYRSFAASNGTSYNGWKINLEGGTYGTDYLQRAVFAVMGLGCNLPEDAVYPSCYTYKHKDIEYKFTGNHKYMLRFPKDSLPPVEGFWSLTMYNQKGFFVDNPNNVNDVYAVGHNKSASFNYGPDGSLDIYIQYNAPDTLKMNNWLPSPQDTFYLMMRLYYPDPISLGPSILNKTWIPPQVVCTDCE